MMLERQDRLTLPELILLLRGLAEQLEAEQGLVVDGQLFPLAEPVALDLSFDRRDGQASLRLGLDWIEAEPPRPVAPAATADPPALGADGGLEPAPDTARSVDSSPAPWATEAPSPPAPEGQPWVAPLFDEDSAEPAPAGPPTSLADLAAAAEEARVWQAAFWQEPPPGSGGGAAPAAEPGVMQLGDWVYHTDEEGESAVDPAWAPSLLSAEELAELPDDFWSTEAGDEAEIAVPVAAQSGSATPARPRPGPQSPPGAESPPESPPRAESPPGAESPPRAESSPQPPPPARAPAPGTATPVADASPALPGLLAYARTPAERRQLAAELALSGAELTALLRRDDLLRLEGLEPEQAAALVELGVAGVADLAARQAAPLAAALGWPSERLAGWIAAAAGLPPLSLHED